ncbi:hypothetical protein ACFWDQ_23840 [Streptomyces sp. NPDC060053]|uniref:hypothetical protein n=1 Tax=Streptomyces sp. NPDC060053 TaxID=3347047 RepID=UPI0036840295
MIVLVLSAILVLVLGGCACVWWAERGGPRWVRVVALVTVTIGEVLYEANRRKRKSGWGGSGGSGNSGGSDD